MTIDHITTSARGIVLHDNKILLMHRIKQGKEYYVLCGGKVENNENAEQACTREILEETTLHVLPTQELFRFSENNQNQIVFLCQYLSGTPQLSGEETQRASTDNIYNPVWIDIDILDRLPIKPHQIKEYLLRFLRKQL